MAKIILRDNFAREWISEQVIQENLTQEQAESELAKLEAEIKYPKHDERFYSIENDEYKPYTFDPNG